MVHPLEQTQVTLFYLSVCLPLSTCKSAFLLVCLSAYHIYIPVCVTATQVMPELFPVSTGRGKTFIFRE